MGDFKLGIVEWACPLRGPYGLKLVHELGLQGVELDFGDYEAGFPLSNPRIQQAYLECGAQFGVEFPSMALNALNKHGMCHPFDSYDGTIAMETIRKGIRAAHEMGIPVVQLPSFDNGEIKDETDFYHVCEKLKVACELAARYGLTVAAENVLAAEETLKMLETVGYDNLKILFDTQNYYLERGYPEAETLQAIHPHVAQIHIKDGFNRRISSALLGTGNVQLRETAEVICRTRCTEWLLLENYYDARPLQELEDDPFTVLERDIRLARELFGISA